MALLKVLRGVAAKTEFVIKSDSVVLGRDPACDICLKQEEISRRHAEIVRVGDRYCVKDLSSHNGTVLNQYRLEPDEPYPLQDRDIVKLCSCYFLYLDQSSDFWTLGSQVDGDMVHFLGGQPIESDSGFASELDSSSDSWSRRTSLNSESKLTAVMKIMREIHDSLSLDAVLAKVLNALLQIFDQADSVVLVLPKAEGGPVVPRVVKRRRKRRRGAGDR